MSTTNASISIGATNDTKRAFNEVAQEAEKVTKATQKTTLESKKMDQAVKDSTRGQKQKTEAVGKTGMAFSAMWKAATVAATAYYAMVLKSEDELAQKQKTYSQTLTQAISRAGLGDSPGSVNFVQRAFSQARTETNIDEARLAALFEAVSGEMPGPENVKKTVAAFQELAKIGEYMDVETLGFVGRTVARQERIAPSRTAEEIAQRGAEAYRARAAVGNDLSRLEGSRRFVEQFGAANPEQQLLAEQKGTAFAASFAVGEQGTRTVGRLFDLIMQSSNPMKMLDDITSGRITPQQLANMGLDKQGVASVRVAQQRFPEVSRQIYGDASADRLRSGLRAGMGYQADLDDAESARFALEERNRQKSVRDKAERQMAYNEILERTGDSALAAIGREAYRLPQALQARGTQAYDDYQGPRNVGEVVQRAAQFINVTISAPQDVNVQSIPVGQ
jgi:hypothetical protein